MRASCHRECGHTGFTVKTDPHGAENRPEPAHVAKSICSVAYIISVQVIPSFYTDILLPVLRSPLPGGSTSLCYLHTTTAAWKTASPGCPAQSPASGKVDFGGRCSLMVRPFSHRPDPHAGVQARWPQRTGRSEQFHEECSTTHKFLSPTCMEESHQLSCVGRPEVVRPPHIHHQFHHREWKGQPLTPGHPEPKLSTSHPTSSQGSFY